MINISIFFKNSVIPKMIRLSIILELHPFLGPGRVILLYTTNDLQNTHLFGGI